MFQMGWLMCVSAAALPPPSVVADAVTADSMSLSFSFNSQYEVAESPPDSGPGPSEGGPDPCSALLPPPQVQQYVVILSWQFDTHVRESRNFTVAEAFLSGSVLSKMAAPPVF